MHALRPHPRFAFLSALIAAGALILSACSDVASFEGSENADSSSPVSHETIVVGSQDYYSNEIIAETYAQALENSGYTVRREFRIGQREVSMPEIQAGMIDVFPEYTGNLLQYLNPEAQATSAEDVTAALKESLPQGLRILDVASASDEDSYVVTTAFAAEHSLVSIADLAKVDGLILGGNSELETRPYGPQGLNSVYGVKVDFTPIEDSGGALTLKALRDGSVQLVDIYSADPALASSDLTVLSDPKGIFRSSRVVPLVSSHIDEDAAAVLNAVSQAMDAADLIEMNRKSTQDGQSARAIARAWLMSQGLLPR